MAAFDEVTVIIGSTHSSFAAAGLQWASMSVSVRAPSLKELAEAKKVVSLENDRWKSTTTRNKTGMPATKLLSNRERARLEKKGSKK